MVSGLIGVHILGCAAAAAPRHFCGRESGRNLNAVVVSAPGVIAVLIVVVAAATTVFASHFSLPCRFQAVA